MAGCFASMLAAGFVADVERTERAIARFGDTPDDAFQCVLTGGNAPIDLRLGLPVVLKSGENGLCFMDIESDTRVSAVCLSSLAYVLDDVCWIGSVSAG